VGILTPITDTFRMLFVPLRVIVISGFRHELTLVILPPPPSSETSSPPSSIQPLALFESYIRAPVGFAISERLSFSSQSSIPPEPEGLEPLKPAILIALVLACEHWNSSGSFYGQRPDSSSFMNIITHFSSTPI
jgi:hypothetical protein